MHQVLEKIKNEPFFKWPNKMVGNPEKRNRNLYCQYHRDHGHTTKDCRSLWDHLDQLVREGKLKQLLHHSSGLRGRTNSRLKREIPLRPPLGTINVIFAAPGRTGSCPSRVMSVARLSFEETNHEPKRARVERPLVIGFSDEDKIGTIQSHDDALVITFRIWGYDVKKVMVDQGSAAEIMYPDLYNGLFQGFNYMASVPPTVMPEGSIPGNGHTVYLQLRRPSVGWMTHLSHRKLLSAINRVGPPAPLVL